VPQSTSSLRFQSPLIDRTCGFAASGARIDCVATCRLLALFEPDPVAPLQLHSKTGSTAQTLLTPNRNRTLSNYRGRGIVWFCSDRAAILIEVVPILWAAGGGIKHDPQWRRPVRVPSRSPSYPHIRQSTLHSPPNLSTDRSLPSADGSLTNVGHPTETSISLLSMALSKIQRGACLLDPSRRAHLLEDLQGAFDQRHVLPCLVALSKATIGKQRLGQFGRALDLL
jgi:hypothetical protein